jgi:hypothetical protein
MDKIVEKELEIWLNKIKEHSVKEIWIQTNLPNLWHYLSDKVGSSFSEKVFILQNGKTNCKKCNSPTQFLSYFRGYREFCSKSCSNSFGDLLEKKKESYKNNNLEKWGVESTSQLEEVKEKIRLSRSKLDYTEINKKIKETSIKNWGVDNPSKSTIIKDKKSKTTIKNWGVQNPFQSDKIKEKIKKTNIINFGVEHPLKSEEVKNRMKSTNIQKWGEDNFTKTNLYKEMMFEKWRSGSIVSKLNRDKNHHSYIGLGVHKMRCDLGLDHIYETNSHLYHARKRINNNQCTICFPVSELSSIKEKEIYDFIKSIYSGRVERNWREELEIDIFLPDLNIGFEFNGLYWHSELFKTKNYHLDKLNHFKKRGIRIINIWEDDWLNKSEIVKSQIKNWIGLNQEKVWARKCEVRKVESKEEIRNFLENNHIQGYVSSSLKLGLYYNNELVSLMTFDHFEGRKSMDESEWNLSRFCNKINKSVVGGASKLLNYFEKEYRPKRIISFADKSWSNGELYYKLGFNLIYESYPNYHYIIEDKRSNKQKWKKSNLIKMGFDPSLTESKIMEENFGSYKIFDCGQLKFQKILF